jgi:hypothetical protein
MPMELHYTPEPSSHILAEASRLLAYSGRADSVVVRRTPDEFVHCSRLSLQRYHPAERRGEVYLLDAGMQPLFFTTNLFFDIVAWRSAERGVLPLHAAAIGRDGRFFIIPGGAGFGKSTLVAAAVAAGFDSLGDDFILWNPADSQVHSLYRTIRLTHESVTLLQDRGDDKAWQPLDAGSSGKFTLAPTSRFANALHPRGHVAGIVVLGEGPELTSAASQPADAVRAFASSLRLLPDLGIPASIGLRTIAKLARSFPIHHIQRKSDIDTMLARIESLLGDSPQ